MERQTVPRLKALVVTKGHPFDKPAFFRLFDTMPGLDWTHVEQPAASYLFRAELTRSFGAIILYDVPGVRFRTPESPRLDMPPQAFREGFEAMLQAGQPFVFLHHAIAGWPAWDRYAEAVGTRFFYQPGTYKGRDYPDSGYVFPVRHHVAAVVDHPVLAGLEHGFEIDDELYLHTQLEPNIIPLLRSSYSFTTEHFWSAAEALRGRMRSRQGWSHPPGTNLVAWARRLGRSPIVYIQCGNDPGAYANPGFQRLLRNTVEWVSGPDAAAWAAGA